METKKKRQYEKPLQRVIELPHRTMLLVGSFTGDRGNPYGDPVTPTGW